MKGLYNSKFILQTKLYLRTHKLLLHNLRTQKVYCFVTLNIYTMSISEEASLVIFFNITYIKY